MKMILPKIQRLLKLKKRKNQKKKRKRKKKNIMIETLKMHIRPNLLAI